MRIQLQGAEELAELLYGHFHQFGDVASADFDIEGFFLEATALAFVTHGFSTVAGQHDTILDFVLVFFQHFEEGVDAGLVARAVQQVILLCLGELVVRSKDREVVGRCFLEEFVQPFSHLLSPPAHHGTVVHTQGTVRDDQVLVDSDYLSKAFADRAGSHRRVEGKHLVGRFAEGHSVGFELGTETVELGGAVGQIETQQAGTVAFVHGGFCRVGESADAVFGIVAAHTVYQQVNLVVCLFLIVFDAYHLSVDLQSGEALLHVHFNLFGTGSSVAGKEGGKDSVSCTRRIRQHAVDDVFGTVFLDQRTADGGVGLSDACEQQPQVLIDFGRGTYRRTGVAADDLLLNGNGRRNPLDKVALGFAHPSQKLTGIRRKAFYIPALPFGIQGIEGERGFPRTGETGNDYQFVAGNVDIDVLQVVDFRSLYGNIIVF